MLIVNYWLVQSSDGLVTSGKIVLPSEQMIIENGCHVIGTKALLSYSQGNSCHLPSNLLAELIVSVLR